MKNWEKLMQYRSNLFKLLVSIFFPLFALANDIADEPQVLNPTIDREIIRSFQLNNSPADWQEDVINILMVGQDGQQALPFPWTRREDGTLVKRLSSRADSTVLISFNRRSGKTTLFTLVRDNIDFSDNNEILTNQYVIKGRGYYIKLVKSRIEKTIRQTGQEKNFFAADEQLHIHGLIEVNFDTFNKILTDVRENLISSVKAAWALRDHAAELLNILSADTSLLKKLRARQNYAAGSYQRSLNHALFLQSIFGVLSYTLVDGAEKDFLSSAFVAKGFNEFSRTFSLTEFLYRSQLINSKNSVLEKSGYINGTSSVDIYLLGVDLESFTTYINGQLSRTLSAQGNTSIDRMMKRLSVEAGQILKPKDCMNCRY
jgi:hypothetical protein